VAITFKVAFYGYQLQVNSQCLIPRPETEEVMLHFLEHCKDGRCALSDATSRVSSIRSVAITFKVGFSFLSTIAIAPLLEVASDNAHQLKADIRFLKGNALKPLIKENIKLDDLVF
jgi:release factor glutamine methyltransferase